MESPLFSRGSRSPRESADKLLETLRARFGLDDFRPWQREAIEALLGDPGRVLVVAPTGGGKSLTYQVPAVMLPGITLVISPLVALMEDQVRALEQRGIPSTFLASTLDPSARRQRLGAMLRGQYKLVYVAPERFQFDGFYELLAKVEVSLLAIDEAHCISMWGHDFRPDYLRVSELVERLKPARLLACTATATPAVRREILSRLGMAEGPHREVLRGFARPNLHLAAQAVDGPTAARDLMRATLGRVLGDPARPRGGAIVYAATRKNTEQISDELRKRGWNALAYHAGLDAEHRTRVSARFAAREVDLVVATNAFGMGIDRPDIRAVIHAQPPTSIESYYQEVGRAGRDGAEAHGLLFCSGLDIALRRRLCELGVDGNPAPRDQAARAWRLFRDLLRYVDAGTCRHDFMLRYFGDDQEILGGCGHCDVCVELDQRGADTETREEATRVARIALSAVARARQRGGMTAIAEMLRGARTERTLRFGFTELSTFGLLQEHPQDWVMSVLRGLLAAGWVDLTPTEHPVPLVTPPGWEALKSQELLRFRLPLRRSARRGRGVAVSAAASASAPPKQGAAPFVEYDPALFERLRAHRMKVAQEKGFPAYVVAFDRSLQEIAARRPATREALLAITGFGPARVDAYGEGFLEIVRGG